MGQRYTAVQWRNWLAEFERSNLTVAKFCESVGASVASFYKWRHRLKAERCDATELIGIERHRRLSPGNFVPLVVRADELEIKLPGGAQVRIANDTDSLRPVLELLFEIGSR